ncbi:MAG TPA: TetR family transcriptional regulator [Solirubrobacterales bacterium]
MAAGSRLNEIQRRAVREDIEGTALRLFLAHGYDATTVDDVAAAVGTSRRTVFRYFETKEDLVLASMRDKGRELVEAATAASPEKDAREALAEVLLGFAEEFDAGLPLSRRRAALLASTPSLQAALALKHLEWRAALGAAISPRLRGARSTRALRAEAIAGAALACLDVAATLWAGDEGGPTLRRRLDVALAALDD